MDGGRSNAQKTVQTDEQTTFANFLFRKKSFATFSKRNKAAGDFVTKV
jgi:hypothetical protein